MDDQVKSLHKEFSVFMHDTPQLLKHLKEVTNLKDLLYVSKLLSDLRMSPDQTIDNQVYLLLLKLFLKDNLSIKSTVASVSLLHDWNTLTLLTPSVTHITNLLTS